MFNKLDELKTSLNIYFPDIICICETHLDNEIDNAEVNIPGYSHFRVDRNFKTNSKNRSVKRDLSDTSEGGGSIIYVRENLNAKVVTNFNAPDSVAVTLQTSIGIFVIACVYRTQALSQTQNRQLLTAMKKLCTDYNEGEVIFVGDLNLPDVCWVSGTVKGPIDTCDKSLCLQNEYIDLITDLGLSWHVTDEITRTRLVDGVLQESTLDQVISSNDAIVNSFKFLSPLGLSDHKCILVELNASSDSQNDFIRKEKVLWGKLMKQNC